MKKYVLKSQVIIALLFGIILGCTTFVGANQAIQAIQNTEIKVSLNGKVQEFKDESTGEIQYPITYHDRTYLPLRNIANLAGLDIDYDEESKTASLFDDEPLTIASLFSSKKAKDTFMLTEESYEKMLSKDEFSGRYILKLYDNDLFFMYNDGYDFEYVFNYMGTYNITSDSIILNFECAQIGDIAQEISANVQLKIEGDHLIATKSSSFNVCLIDWKYPVRRLSKEETIIDFLEEGYSFVELTLKNSIKVRCGKDILLSNQINNIRPANEFRINCTTSAYDINEIEYWFDENEPKKMSINDTIPALYLHSPYKSLNIRVRADEEEVILKYDLNIQEYILGIVEKKTNNENGEPVLQVNGKEYTIKLFTTGNADVGDLVFIEDYQDGDYIVMECIRYNDIEQRFYNVTMVDDNRFEYKNISDDKVNSKEISSIYSSYGSVVYLEYDDNSIVKYEMSPTRDHKTFKLMIGDKVNFSNPNIGRLVVARKKGILQNEEKFFNDNQNSISIIAPTINNILMEKNEYVIYLNRYLKENEQLKIDVEYENESLTIFKGRIKEKTFTLTGKNVFESIKKWNKDIDGMKCNLIVSVINNKNSIVNSEEFIVTISEESTLKIDCDFEDAFYNNKNIILSLSRKLRENEDVRLRLNIFTNDEWVDSISILSGEFESNIVHTGPLTPKMTILSDNKVEVDIKHIYERIINVLTEENLLELNQNGGMSLKNVDENKLKLRMYVDATSYEDYGNGMKGGIPLFQTHYDAKIELNNIK